MSTYTVEQLERRRSSKWTLVQIVGAPIQLLIFLISCVFVTYTLITGDGFVATQISFLVKVIFLYFMCITGMFWENEVFGQYYFAPEFFKEDFVTTIVMLAHTVCLIALLAGVNDKTLLWLIIIAYSSYVINAIQYFVKFLRNREKKKAIIATAEIASK